MPARLVVLTTPNEGQVFSLPDNAKLVLGRDATANIQVTDPAVSRSHCVIECSGSKAVLTDSGSRSGTRVNGKTITSNELVTGDVINIGNTKLRFEWLAPPEPKEMPKEVTRESADVEALRALSGTTLGNYAIGAVVAVGNSGMIFRAHDSKNDREVALKVYTPEFAKNDEDMQRFIRAVKTMLPMRHLNLVTLYGGGKTGPYCWMSMEYVEGESLKETIDRIGKKGKLDWRPALRVALDISRGLHYIHGEQIIHRNLSPGNILHTRTGTAKLGSLILAKAMSGALAKDVTTGGAFLSDVRYLAPEQVGGSGVVDGRADIYSLGTLVYALLTGKPPFDEKSPFLTVGGILQKEPRPPRAADPSIPEALEKIVLRMLAKKQEDRFQSAAELLAELEELPRA